MERSLETGAFPSLLQRPEDRNSPTVSKERGVSLSRRRVGIGWKRLGRFLVGNDGIGGIGMLELLDGKGGLGQVAGRKRG